MKKIIISLFLFLSLIIASYKPAYADCINKSLLGCDSAHSNACGDGNTCCYSSSECSQYPAPTAPSNPVTPGTGGQCPRGYVGCSTSTGKLCYPAGIGCPAGSAQQTMIPGGNLPSIGSSSNPTCNGGNGIDTAIGCIPVNDTSSFMGWILGWAIGVGGGIAFLLIVYASFMIMTSQGDPTRLKAGQELLTSAISGLIMLIFSVFILKFIGIDILRLNNL